MERVGVKNTTATVTLLRVTLARSLARVQTESPKAQTNAPHNEFKNCALKKHTINSTKIPGKDMTGIIHTTYKEENKCVVQIITYLKSSARTCPRCCRKRWINTPVPFGFPSSQLAWAWIRSHTHTSAFTPMWFAWIHEAQRSAQLNKQTKAQFFNSDATYGR